MLNQSPRDWYYTSEVAEILKVGPKTVSRWAKEGKIPCETTLGGHRRYYKTVVEDLRQRMTEPA